MAFVVKRSGLEAAPEALSQYSSRISHMETAVRLIRRIVLSDQLSFEGFRGAFEGCLRQLEREARELEQLGEGLEASWEVYKSTEERVIKTCKASKSYKESEAGRQEAEEAQRKYRDYKHQIDQLYERLTFKTGDYIGTLGLWKDLILKMHLENPSACELTKAEKVAILMAIKPIASATDNAYDQVAAIFPLLDILVNKGSDSLNHPWANAIEEKGVELLSTNGLLQRLLGFCYREESDSYYTVEDSLQNQWGFCDYMDEMASTMGMDLDTKITTFNYDGQEFRLQLWKGTYGYDSAVGGEFGLYSRPDWEASGERYEEGQPASEMILYDAVSEEYQLPVKQIVTYRDEKGQSRRIVNDTAVYGDGDHYWNLNIRTEAGIEKEAVSSIYEIDCSGQEKGFQQALYNSLVAEEGLQVMQEGSTVIVSYQ